MVIFVIVPMLHYSAYAILDASCNNANICTNETNIAQQLQAIYCAMNTPRYRTLP